VRRGAAALVDEAHAGGRSRATAAVKFIHIRTRSSSASPFENALRARDSIPERDRAR
jgi:hypothetical protein